MSDLNNYNNQWPSLSSWDEFDSYLSDICLENPKAAGTLFERFCKSYLMHSPDTKGVYANVWLEREIPNEVRAILNLPQTDHGADLVCMTVEGQYAVVQCKFTSREEKRVLNWSQDKLSSWLAASSKADIRILFTNSDGLDEASSAKAHEKDFRLINFANLKALKKQTLENIIGELTNRQIRTKTNVVEPRDYQIEAIKESVQGLHSNSIGKLILPCGAGKTLTALWIAEKLPASKTLVLVPSLALLAQFKNVWREHEKETTHFFCVCSEKDIAKGTDEASFSIEEISAKVTTNPTEIRSLLQSASDRIVVYSTYQSSRKIAEALKGTDIKFDLTICDEAHRTAGSREGTFATVHDYIPSHKKLFMTATPRIVSKILQEKLGQKYQYFADMNDESTYGSEFYRMAFAEAIDRGVLVDYQIVVVGVSDAEIQKQIRNRKWALDNATAEDVAQNYALEKAIKDYGFTHAVTFHSSIKRAQLFSDRHKNYFPGAKAFHINGTHSSSERIRILDEFANSPSAIVSNARCLTEGVDLPAIDAVMFCDSKTSKTDIVQAAGRALRKDKKKPNKVGYIIVPIFHTNSETVEEAIAGDPFKHLISVVRALADHDSRLEDEITQISVGLGKRRALGKVVRIQDGTASLIELSGFKDKLGRTIFSQIIDKTVIPWLVQFEHLREYRKKYPKADWPHWNVEYPKGNNLGGWVQHIRREFKQQRLAEDKVEALKQIDFDFELPEDREARLLAAQEEERERARKAREEAELRAAEERKEAEWEKDLQVVATMVNHPDLTGLEPGRYYRGDKEGLVVEWIKEQRSLNKKGNLKQSRVQKFESIGLPMVVTEEYLKTQKEIELAAQIKLLKRYMAENGSPQWIVSSVEYPEGYRLGAWCVDQRRQFKAGKLPQNEIQLMQECGIDFEFTYENQKEMEKLEKQNEWAKQYNILKEYRHKFPDRPFPYGNVEYPEGNQLGKWCQSQRVNYSQKNLSVEYETKLRELGFNFSRDREADERQLWHLGAEGFFKAISNIPDFYSDLSNIQRLPSELGIWFDQQRRHFHNGRLTAKQVAHLKLRGFVFYTPKDIADWDVWYQKIVSLYDQVNGLGWPEVIKDYNERLAEWIGKQARIRDARGLPKELEKKMDSLLRPTPAIKNLGNDWFVYLNKFRMVKNENRFLPSAFPGYDKWKLDLLESFRQRKLRKIDRRILEASGFSFNFNFEDKYRQQWNWQLENLREYLSQDGLIPDSNRNNYKFPEHNPIGRWFVLQMVKMKFGKLTGDQVAALKDAVDYLEENHDYALAKSDLQLSDVDLVIKYGDYWFFTEKDCLSFLRPQPKKKLKINKKPELPIPVIPATTSKGQIRPNLYLVR